MPEKRIHHVICVWDESDHLSVRNVERKAEAFLRAYMDAFPEAYVLPESPRVASTRSPILGHVGVDSFLHEREFVPYSGANKDLALVKYCICGLVDQRERYHFLLDDIRNRCYVDAETPLEDNDLCLVVFFTTDHGGGMTSAIHKVVGADNIRTSYLLLRVHKDLGSTAADRMKAFGEILGSELRSLHVSATEDGLVLEMPESPRPNMRSELS